MGTYCFGIDVGGTTVKCGLFSTDGTLVEKWEIPTRKENNGDQILPDVAAAVNAKIEERGISKDDVEGVNKFDDPNADLEGLLEQMREIWGPGVLPINLPTKNHTHVIDCFEREEGESDIMSVEDVHRAFIERIVEEDDEALERYLEEGSVDPRILHPLITKALREGHIIPVCFTSAKNLIGIRDFMKVIIRHLPSPAEANDALFVTAEGEPYVTKPERDLPVVAQVFKIVNDPYIGKIGVFRVHQGTITKDSTLYVDDGKNILLSSINP